MAAPLLLMSTSSSSAGQDMSRNPVPPAGPEAQTRQEAPTKPAGRGKRATKPPAQKRPPQRGLGVAQLERLRQQEHWKKMAEMPHHQLQTHVLDPAMAPAPLTGAPIQYCPADYFMGSPPPVACPAQMLGGGRGLGVQRSGGFPYGTDRVAGSLYNMAGVGGSAAAVEPPRELSSMPNVRCFTDRCDICSLKKKNIINARNIVVLEYGAGDHINNREKQATNSRDFLALNLGNSFSCSGNFTSREENYTLHGNRRAIDQDVEVMDMRIRKVNAAGLAGGDSLLMEYEFFPGKSNSGRSIFPERLCFPAAEDLEAAPAPAVTRRSSGSGGGAGAGAGAGGEASSYNYKDPNSIDLSLRLSY